jgi:hypothetical protein
MLLGLNNSMLPVAIGYSSVEEVPVMNIYEYKYASNSYIDIVSSKSSSNYYINNKYYIEEKTVITSNYIDKVTLLNPKVLNDKIYGLYVNNGLHTDTLVLCNSSNYNTCFVTNDNQKQNIKYIMPVAIDINTYNTDKTKFLSCAVHDDKNELYWQTFDSYFANEDISLRNLTISQNIISYNYIGVGSNLRELNLADRDTSLLKEGSNLYYTDERVGRIAHSSNVKSMNYTLLTSNMILNRISTLTTDDIVQGYKNFYLNSNKFDELLSSRTLDNIPNGTSNKYISNDIYTNNLLITGTLTVGKIQVLGIDFPSSGNQISFASKDEVTILKQQVYDLMNIVNVLSSRLYALENA